MNTRPLWFAIVLVLLAPSAGWLYASGRMNEKLDTVALEVNHRRPVIDAVPIIQSNLDNLKSTVDEVRRDVKEMQRTQQEILLEVRKR